MSSVINVLRTGIEQGLHTAAQVCVIHRGQVVIDDALGPISRDHLMLWMSAGKPLAAVAVLQLVATGLLTLDTLVGDVVEGFAAHGKERITLRHLLTHTAGFRGPMNNFTPGTWEQVIRRACQLKQEPNWEPGKKAGYHVGSSWFILGEIVRVMSGLSFDEYVQRYIAPGVYVGMTREHLELIRPKLVEMRVTDADSTTQFNGNTDEAITVPRPGANARGPIRLLTDFYRRLFASTKGNDDLLPTELARQMTTRQRVGMYDATFHQTLDWGLGVMIDSKSYVGEHLYGYGPHASGSTFGHSGNQSSCGFVDPRHDLIVAWATDGMPGEPQHQARQRAINVAIYQELRLV